jgi:hypothetical protein
MATEVKENVYKFALKKVDQQQIDHTNGTTRTLLFRELVVVVDANGAAFLGFVAETDGIAAAATGKVELYEGDEISTTQFTAATFVPGDSVVWVLVQTNSSQALIKEASTVGAYPLNALIISYHATNGLRLRMPHQDGTAAIVT